MGEGANRPTCVDPALSTTERGYPSTAHEKAPFDAGSVIWFPQHDGATRLFAFLQLGAAVTLGIFVATAVSRLRFLGVRVAGVDIAFPAEPPHRS